MLPKIRAACIALGVLVGCKQTTTMSGPVAVAAQAKAAGAAKLVPGERLPMAGGAVLGVLRLPAAGLPTDAGALVRSDPL